MASAHSSFKRLSGALSSALALVATAAGLTACGGGGGDTAPPATATSSATATAALPAPAAAASSATTATSASTTPSTTIETSAVALTTAAVNAIRIRASGALANGEGTLVRVRYNGNELGTVEIRSPDMADYQLPTVTAPNGGDVDLVLTNATDTQGGALRHLKIESVSVGDQTLKATDSRALFDQGSGVAALDGQDLRAASDMVVSNGAWRIRLPASTTATAAAVTATSAAGYYVDADNGDDTAPGTHDRPWRTLAKASGMRLQTGQGLYLRCGRVWHESLVLSSAQLVPGAVIAGYGSECATQKAVITGSDDVSGGWQLSGNVWSRALPAGTPKITQLFVESQAMRTAQWPNAAAAGNLPVAATASTTSRIATSTGDASSLSGKDLVGATIQVRTQPWYVETRKVASASAGTLTLDSMLEWSLTVGETYVLQDKLWMLDAPGEFFHDVATQRLYLMAPASGVPSNLNAARIEASVRDAGLSVVGVGGLVIRDLTLRNMREDGLRVDTAPGSTVSRIEAIDNARSGVRMQQPAAAAVTVTDSLVSGSGVYGIDAFWAENAVITGNHVLATGTGAQQLSNVLAAIDAGPASRISGNVVDGSAYIGVRFSTLRGSVVSGNTISHYCRRLTDCAAIYTWAGRDLATAPQAATVENNRILEGQAQLQAVISTGREVVGGIYLDDFARNVAVRGNVMTGTPIGIFIHNASDLVVENNRIWMPSLVGIWASMDQTDADWMRNNVFRNNVLAPLVTVGSGAAGQPTFFASLGVWFWHTLNGAAALGNGRNLFIGNTTLQLQGSLVTHAMVRGADGTRYLDQLDWVALNPGEPVASRPSRYDPLAPVLGEELVVGGSFDGGLGNWRTYQNPAGSGFALQGLASNTGCTGGCLSMTAGHVSDLIASPAFTLRASATYVYRWTAVMPDQSSASVGFPYISRDTSPWDVMADASGFSIYGPRRGAAREAVSYEAYFVAKESALSRVNLQLESLGLPVAFDNVSVREVLSYTIAQRSDWFALAMAPAAQSRIVTCAELNWPSSCRAMTADGQAVTLPLTMAPGTDLLLLRADSGYRKY